MSWVSSRALTTTIGMSLLRRTSRMQSNPDMPAEHEVDQHDVGVDLGERPQGLLGAGGLRDLVPLVLQGQPEHGTDAVVVLDEEHPHGHATMLAQAPSALRPPVRGTGGFVIRPQRAGRYVRKVRCSL